MGCKLWCGRSGVVELAADEVAKDDDASCEENWLLRCSCCCISISFARCSEERLDARGGPDKAGVSDWGVVVWASNVGLELDGDVVVRELEDDVVIACCTVAGCCSIGGGGNDG